MLHMLLIILGSTFLIGIGLSFIVSACMVAGYFLFCGPYLWWASAYLPRDKRPFSMVRDYRNAFRYYKSRFTGKPPAFL